MCQGLRSQHGPVIVLVVQSCRTFCDPTDYSSHATLSMDSSEQEYWIGLPFLSPGDHPNPGIKLRSPTLQADSLPSKPPGMSMTHESIY